MQNAIAPMAPTLVSVVAITNNDAKITWTVPNNPNKFGTGGFVNYIIYAENSSGTITWVDLVSTTTTRIISGLTAGETYSFVMFITNGAGLTTGSNYLTQRFMNNNPDAPTITSVVPSSPSTEVIRWTAPTFTGNSAITSYTVNVYSGWAPMVAKRTPYTANTSPYSITGLTPGETYTVTVTATNSTRNSSSESDPIYITAGAPAPPLIKSVAWTASASAVVVTWQAPPAGTAITGYKIIATSINLPVVTLSAASTATSATIDILGGAEYSYAVIATNTYGDSIPSPILKKSVMTPPSAPMNLIDGVRRAVGGSTSQVTVNMLWDEPVLDGGSPVTNYVLTVVDMTNPSTPKTTTYTSNTNNYILTTTLGNTYTVTATAKNSVGAGRSSSKASLFIDNVVDNNISALRVTTIPEERIATIPEESLAALIPNARPRLAQRPKPRVGPPRINLVWLGLDTVSDKQATVYFIAPSSASAMSWAFISCDVYITINGNTYYEWNVGPIDFGEYASATLTVRPGDIFTVTAELFDSNQTKWSFTSDPYEFLPASSPPVILNAVFPDSLTLSAVVTWSEPTDRGFPGANINNYTITMTPKTTVRGARTLTQTVSGAVNTATFTTGMVPEIQYDITVTAINSANMTAVSSVFTPRMGVPDPITVESLVTVGNGRELQLTWRPLTSTGGYSLSNEVYSVVEYQCYATDISGKNPPLYKTYSSNIRKTNYVTFDTSYLVDLFKGITFRCHVIAVNRMGGSTPVPVDIYIGLPSIPKSVSLGVFPAPNRVTLNWAAPTIGENLKEHLILATITNISTNAVIESKVFTIAPSTTSFIHPTSPTLGTKYTFKIRARNGLGDSGEFPISCKMVLPSAPVSLTGYIKAGYSRTSLIATSPLCGQVNVVANWGHLSVANPADEPPPWFIVRRGLLVAGTSQSTIIQSGSIFHADVTTGTWQTTSVSLGSNVYTCEIPAIFKKDSKNWLVDGYVNSADVYVTAVNIFGSTQAAGINVFKAGI